MAQLLVCVWALLSIAEKARGFFDRRSQRMELQNSPLSISKAAEFATVEQHERLAAEVKEMRLDRDRKDEALRKEIKSDLVSIGKSIKEDIVHLHNRINDQTKAISRLEGKLEKP